MGGGGSDVLVGGGGADSLAGGPGADRLFGGGGADAAGGGRGEDLVAGGLGNDDLAGGPGADDIEGGPGTNWCTLDAADAAQKCVHDRNAPKVVEPPTSSLATVDVTHSSQLVKVRVHVVDDTGVKAVTLFPGADTPWFPTGWAKLVDGTVRDGWWEATVRFEHWVKPGTYRPRVRVWDRVDRRIDVSFDDPTVIVENSQPDEDLPHVWMLTPTPNETFDTRSAGKVVTVRVRITDALSGVDAEGTSLIMWAPRLQGRLTEGIGAPLRLRQGTIHDGVWSGDVWLPRNSAGGDWTVGIDTKDRAQGGTGTSVTWWGPGEYYPRLGEAADNRLLPDGMGSVHVLGRERTDTTPPTISSAVVTPTEVDTLAGPASVDVSVRAADPGSGVAGVSARLLPATSEEDSPEPPDESLDLVDGTAADGLWTGSIRIPQGFPPGTYYLQVIVWDREDNMIGYYASGHPYAFDYVLPGNPTVTVVEATP